MAMSSENSTSATPPSTSSCPVNHEAREVWLRRSNLNSSNNDINDKVNEKSDTPSTSSSKPSSSSPSSKPLPHSYLSQPCDSSAIDQTSSTSTTANPSSTTMIASATPSSQNFSPSILSFFPFNRQRHQAAATSREQQLDTERQVSTIPRVSLNTPGSSEDTSILQKDGKTQDTSAKAFSNGNTTRTTVAAGNWIYPSERMFFDAMRRKSYDPKAEDMRAIVPIHNAVNEKAWKEIREWETGKGAEKYVFFCSLPSASQFYSFYLSSSKHVFEFAIQLCHSLFEVSPSHKPVFVSKQN